MDIFIWFTRHFTQTSRHRLIRGSKSSAEHCPIIAEARIYFSFSISYYFFSVTICPCKTLKQKNYKHSAKHLSVIYMESLFAAIEMDDMWETCCVDLWWCAIPVSEYNFGISLRTLIQIRCYTLCWKNFKGSIWNYLRYAVYYLIVVYWLLLSIHIICCSTSIFSIFFMTTSQILLYFFALYLMLS